MAQSLHRTIRTTTAITLTKLNTPSLLITEMSLKQRAPSLTSRNSLLLNKTLTLREKEHGCYFHSKHCLFPCIYWVWLLFRLWHGGFTTSATCFSEVNWLLILCLFVCLFFNLYFSSEALLTAVFESALSFGTKAQCLWRKSHQRQ